MLRRQGVLLGVLLFGSTTFLGLSIHNLPRQEFLFRAPETPLDQTGAQDLISTCRLLMRADGLIPRGATVVVRSEPPDAAEDTMLHQLGVALLPDRTVLPAALWSMQTPNLAERAGFIVLRGQRPNSLPGKMLLMTTSEGSIWRRQ